jgi:L,D-transpeptidase catalytic domain
LGDGLPLAQFPVSTSKFGLGDRPRSYATPIGLMEVAAKIGDRAPLGMVFKGRRPTGEILRPNAPGRDPIVTRILHLRGLDSGTAGAYGRGIYIHGTAEERTVGRPASYGCIRMKSRDVVRLFDAVTVGTRIAVVNVSISKVIRQFSCAQGTSSATAWRGLRVARRATTVHLQRLSPCAGEEIKQPSGVRFHRSKCKAFSPRKYSPVWRNYLCDH